MKSRPRRWIWLIAALLPIGLYAVIAERNSWRPQILRSHIPADTIGDSQISWQDNYHLWVTRWAGKRTLLQLWDTRTRQLLKTSFSPTACDAGTEQALDNGNFICFSPHGKLYLWNAAKTTVHDAGVIWTENFVSQHFGVVTLSPKTVGTTHPDCRDLRSHNTLNFFVHNLLAKRLERKFQLKAPRDYIFRLCVPRGHSIPLLDLSSDGTLGAIAMSPVSPYTACFQDILVFDSHSGTYLKRWHITVDKENINQIACSPDGSQIAIVKEKGASVSQRGQYPPTLQLCNARTGQLILQSKEDSEIRRMSFAPSGEWIAIGTAKRMVRIWNTRTGQLQREMSCSFYAHQLKFSPDGRTLAAAEGNGKTITLWRVK
jgi:WD40 repeat protein